VDSGFEEGDGRPGVHVVRRDDRNRLNPVRALGLRLRHALEIVVDAVGGEAEHFAGAASLLRRRRQRAGDEFVLVVNARGNAVHLADERALSAAHHAEPDAPAIGRANSLYHETSLRSRLIVLRTCPAAPAIRRLDQGRSSL